VDGAPPRTPVLSRSWLLLLLLLLPQDPPENKDAVGVGAGESVSVSLPVMATLSLALPAPTPPESLLSTFWCMPNFVKCASSQRWRSAPVRFGASVASTEGRVTVT
jgi:hypothetical protein